MQNKAYLAGTVFLLSLFAVPITQAHNVASESAHLLAGLSHPLLGWDHWLAMFAVGLWSAQQNGRLAWYLPAVFLSLMTVGAITVSVGLPLPAVEAGIAISLLILGLLLAFAVRLPIVFGTVVVGLFALIHGVSHGAQIPPAASAVTYGAGLMLASTLMQLLGFRLGRHYRDVPSRYLLRFAGGAVAAGSILAWV